MIPLIAGHIWVVLQVDLGLERERDEEYINNRKDSEKESKINPLLKSQSISLGS
jgi:hypothetical protein